MRDRPSWGTSSVRPRALAALALGLLVLLAGLVVVGQVTPSFAQSSPAEVPTLETDGRIYRVNLALSSRPSEQAAEAALARTLDALEAGSERRFFVVLVADAPASVLARATATAWTRAVAADATLPFRPDSSVLVVASARNAEVALELPAAVRDRLGVSPFAVERLAATTFAPQARRGELALAADSFVHAVASWLDEAQARCDQEKLALHENEARPPAPEPAAVSEALEALEARAWALASRGADVSSAEPLLTAARADLRRAVLARDVRPETAVAALKRAEGSLAAARATVEHLETERAQVRERASRLELEVRNARLELKSAVPGVATALDHATAQLAEARRTLEAKPHDAAKALEEVEGALAQARAAVPVVPTAALAAPDEPTLSISRLIAVLLALVPLALAGLFLGLREARTSAREELALRRDQVQREANELRAALEALRESRDRLAQPKRVSVAKPLAEDLAGAAATPVPTFGAKVAVEAAPPSPAGTVPSPAGTVPSPAETVPSPAGTVPSPAGTVPSPAGTVPSPAETVPSPAGTVPSPAETAPSPAATPAPPVVAAPAPESSPVVPPAATVASLEAPKSGTNGTARESNTRSASTLVPGSRVSQRLRALEERSELPAAAGFAGETQRLLDRANGAIADLGAIWDNAEGALGDAETRALRASMLSSEALIEARAGLDLVPGRVDLEPRIEHARDLLDTLEDLGDRATSALASMSLAFARAEDALDVAVERGLAPAAFEDDVAQAHDHAREALFAAATDPLRAASLAVAVEGEARRIEEAVGEAEGVRAEILRLGDEVGRLGERLSPAGQPRTDDPVALHERSQASLAEAESALELGVPEEARKEIGRARESLRLAEEALGHKEDARAGGVAPLEERRTEAREAKGGLERARTALAALEAEFARGSWDDVAPPFEAAERTVPALDATLEATASLLGPDGGPAARTRVQLLRLDSHLTELRRTAAAIERRLAGLREDRSGLARRAGELERRLADVEGAAKDEEISVRADTVTRLEQARASVERVGLKARTPGEQPDLPALLREIDSLEVELDEVRTQVSRDAFLCRRALNARRAAEVSVRSAEDARRRGRDRLAARQREARARELLERTEQVLPKLETDWHVVLDAYSSIIRAAYGARELAGRRDGPGSDLRHALREAHRSIRRAERFDAPFVRVDAEPARVLLRRAHEAAEAGDEGQAVEHAEKAAGAADDARRAALQRSRALDRERERGLREAARAQRPARERLERRRLLAETHRRAAWIGLRFGPRRDVLSFEDSSAALKSVQV